jgi:signal transduction histidine kinase
VGVGGVTGTKSNLPLSIAATFIVAVAFEPAKGRMERLANRIVYGHRATPYEVLSEFSERVADAVASEELLARMARVLGEGTGAEHAAVWLAVGDEMQPTATWPDTERYKSMTALKITGPQIPWIDGVTNAVAVRHQGELFGALSVTKAGNDTLTATEDKLMADLGRQAGLVLRNLRLTAELRARLEELRASRQRIVAAGDEERRRLERNLHDGAQQELVAIKVQLSLAEDMADELEGDNEPLLELLAKLKEQTGDAVESLRDLARGIYPPLLAAEGLRAALSAQARKSPLDITVEADDLGRYPQDIEAAVYFCCLEAFQNAAKYAGDCEVTAILREEDGVLRFDVSDSGCGFDQGDAKAGMGTRNMSDRLESLDGSLTITSAKGVGTTVTGKVPIPPS